MLLQVPVVVVVAAGAAQVVLVDNTSHWVERTCFRHRQDSILGHGLEERIVVGHTDCKRMDSFAEEGLCNHLHVLVGVEDKAVLVAVLAQQPFEARWEQLVARLPWVFGCHIHGRPVAVVAVAGVGHRMGFHGWVVEVETF